MVYAAKTEGQKRFTLVELLVVIAIISILAGMLLPALENARKAAQSAACMSNVKQMSMGFTFYAEDFDGLIPPIRMYIGTPENITWPLLVQPYLEDTQVFNCPHYKPYIKTNTMSVAQSYWIHYGLNAWIGNPRWTSTYYTDLAPYQLVKAKNPAKTMLNADSRNNMSWGGEYGSYILNHRKGYVNTGPTSHYYQYALDDVHQDGSNASFLDGHAAHIDRHWADYSLWTAHEIWRPNR